MKNKLRDTEEKILQSASHIFILYGFHGTTLNRIALHAGIHKSIIHYYFRSKENLYGKVITEVLEDILDSDFDVNTKAIIGQRWFIYTEMYNNRNCFERMIRKIYPVDWSEKLKKIDDFVKISINSL